MCGIIGIFGNGDLHQGSVMLEAISHRGPDGRGLRQVEGAMLGHSRLSILDLDCGAQPMSAGNTLITYNGEVYNYRALQEKYLSGRTLHGHSDTEVLLHLYRMLGPAMVTQLDGMFAMAIVNDDELFLARDPLGIKPLYYGTCDQGFCFGSEIRSLSHVCSNVCEFPAGHWYSSKKGWHRYYSVPDKPGAFTGTREEAMREIHRLMGEAVEKRMLADVPVGISLSGGLDSSIVAMLAARKTKHLHSFAVGMEGGEDLPAARAMAEFLGTRHHEYVYTHDEIVEAVPTVVKHLESCDAALVRSAIPNYFLAKLASRTVKVILTGEGADELYAGYDYMARFTDPLLLQKEMVETTAALHNTNLQRADRLSMALGLEARVPFLDVACIDFALSLPPEWKLHNGKQQKQLLRDVFRADLPGWIADRPKAKFSKGAGSCDVLKEIAYSEIPDHEYEEEKARIEEEFPGAIPTKEHLLCHRLMARSIPPGLIHANAGRSRSL